MTCYIKFKIIYIDIITRAINNENLLKLFFIIHSILVPNFCKSIEMIKNLKDLLIIDAKINVENEILLIPADIENILLGIGVKPAVKIIKKPCSSNISLIFENISIVNSGTFVKK